MRPCHEHNVHPSSCKGPFSQSLWAIRLLELSLYFSLQTHLSSALLAEDAKPSRLVQQVHSRLHLVHVLPTRTTCACKLDLDVIWIDLRMRGGVSRVLSAQLGYTLRHYNFFLFADFFLCRFRVSDPVRSMHQA